MTTSQSIRTFATWLSEQTDRDDPIGDLARDFVEDTSAPHNLFALSAHIVCEWRKAKREWREGASFRRELRS